MKYLAAYLLLIEGGNATPSLKDIQEVIEAVGAEFESARAESLLASLEGKTVQELIAAGSEKLGSLPSGGAASAGAAGASGAAAGGDDAAAEEKQEEEAEESDDDMGFGLFD